MTLLIASAEVIIGGIYETKIAGIWSRVRVVDEREPRPSGLRMFGVVRDPPAKNCLKPRAWVELRKVAP